ncbi:hypothetical protein MMC10_008504 [Thelotrema lepadinum]|nr:hypothetical protein [Thelotrema lepadinum]
MSSASSTCDSSILSLESVEGEEFTEDIPPLSIFFRLPIELRLQVYEYVLEGKKIVYAHDLPPIFEVSRQISSEVLQGCLRDRTICFILHGRGNGDEEPWRSDIATFDDLDSEEPQTCFDQDGWVLSERINRTMTWLRSLEPGAWSSCYEILIFMSIRVLINLVAVPDKETRRWPKSMKNFWPNFCSLIRPGARWVSLCFIDDEREAGDCSVYLFGNASLRLLGKHATVWERKENNYAAALDCSSAAWMKVFVDQLVKTVSLRVDWICDWDTSMDRPFASTEEDLARFNAEIKEKLWARVEPGDGEIKKIKNTWDKAVSNLERVMVLKDLIQVSNTT